MPTVCMHERSAVDYQVNEGALEKGPFEVNADIASHQIHLSTTAFDYSSQGEPCGQLLCCFAGEIKVTGPAGSWSLPADYMIYIPCDRPFRTSSAPVASYSIVKFNRNEVAWEHNGCWVGPINDFARQMIGYGSRWTQSTVRGDCAAANYFSTLGGMLPEWFRHERINWTPIAVSVQLQKAVDLVANNGLSLSINEVARHIGMSERTLRRKLQAEIGQSWREFTREMKMNKAMEMLRRDRLSVTDTALELGFASSSAFSFAFSKYVGQTPSSYARSFTGSAANVSG